MTRQAFLAVVFGVAAACTGGPRSQPWVEDGTERGCITVHELGAGQQLEYRDHSGHVVKVEHRDASGLLLPGGSVELRTYDAERRLSRICFRDALGRPAAGAQGQWAERVEYQPIPAGIQVVRRFLDEAGREANVPGGWSCRIETTSGGRLVRIEFLRADGKPATAEYQGVEGTARVDYSYLSGVTTVVYAVWRGPAGEVLAKRKLSGLVYEHVVESNYVNGMPTRFSRDER